MEATSKRKIGWFGGTVGIVFVVLALACFFFGGTPYAYVWVDWANHGYVFDNVEMAVDWVFGLVGAAIIALGLVFLGIALRLARWPLGGLLLSIVAVAFLIGTFLIYSRTGNASDSIEVVLLEGLCILGLFVVALPPFLHWLLAKRQIPAAVTLPKAQ